MICLAVDFKVMVPVAVFDPGDPIAVAGGFAFILALLQTWDTSPAQVVLAIIMFNTVQAAATLENVHQILDISKYWIWNFVKTHHFDAQVQPQEERQAVSWFLILKP